MRHMDDVILCRLCNYLQNMRHASESNSEAATHAALDNLMRPYGQAIRSENGRAALFDLLVSWVKDGAFESVCELLKYYVHPQYLPEVGGVAALGYVLDHSAEYKDRFRSDVLALLPKDKQSELRNFSFEIASFQSSDGWWTERVPLLRKES
jgi:hypothetical protein